MIGEGRADMRVRGVLIGIAGLLVIVVGIPALLVMRGTSDIEERAGETEQNAVESQLKVRVFLSKEKRVIDLPLESYIEGVVAAEMPAQFQLEALKAQALAARTYVVGRLLKNQRVDGKRWGSAAAQAHVTDTVEHQVFITDAALREQWGYNYGNYKRRVAQAVQETAGQIIIYQGKPIYAAFFSTSNGRTENSEDYFQEKYPYLRSVDSSWDQLSPKYFGRISLKQEEFLRRLEQGTGKKLAVSAFAADREKPFAVLSRTDGQRVEQIRIAGKLFKGREVREALNLPSSDFQLELNGDEVNVTTKGYGHGVGMSQWGANLMADQGKSVEEIIKHYYRGVQIGRLDLKND